MTNMSDLLSAALAGRYRVVRELGHGGMATVYLAEDLKHERKVALKVLKPEVAESLGPTRFQREITTTANLRHPHILPLFDSGEVATGDGGTAVTYYVMPWVEGESLRDRLERSGPLPIDDALRIAGEVADALGYAHGQGVIHRDIKPENILLDGGHALVADFGIARAIHTTENASVTQTGVALGTPGYMSPEQALGSRDLDGRSDVYALGCLTYEMLAGQPPFTSPTAQGVLHQHMAAEPRPVSELRAGVPAPVVVALRQALAKRPEDRFQTPTAFAAALRVPPRRGVDRATLRWGLAAAVALAGAVGALRLWTSRSAPAAIPPTAIAVLPFRSLSVDSSQAYFAAGLHDELLTQLAMVGSLQVRGHTSVEGYRNTTKPLKQVGEELAVGSIVEGSLQVDGKRLRVRVRLLDPVTQAERWSDAYDRTLDDAFAVQSDIATRIVKAVGVTLTTAEARGITAPPTGSAEAYGFYLQGLDYLRRPGMLRANFEAAQQLFDRALALDPGFALAHAAVSRVHGGLYGLGYDRSPHRAALAQRAAEEAVRLAPGQPEVRLAMGWRDVEAGKFGAALEEFTSGLREAPNHAELWKWKGIAERPLGNWDSAFVAFDRARRLNPRDADLLQIVGDTYHYLHRFREAMETYRQALAFAPDLVQPRLSLAWSHVLWTGSLDTLRAVLRSLPTDADPGGGGGPILAQRMSLARLARQPDSLRSLARLAPWLMEASDGALLGRVYWLEWAFRHRGDTVAARALLDSAAVVLGAQVRARPEEQEVHQSRGMVLARLGRRAEARREAEWLARWEERQRDNHYNDPGSTRAVILALAGDIDGARAALEQRLSGPSLVTVPLLRLDPTWDPITRDPRFDDVLRRHAQPGS